MKKALYLIAAVVMISISAFAGNLVNVAGASGIALDGYDAVAFFSDQKPIHGDPTFSVVYKGATYIFASKDHQQIFKADPKKYVPQFGGYCAYGAAEGALFPVDINTWQVRNGKLYLNLNPTILALFNGSFDDYVAKAERNWPDLVAKSGK